MGNPGWQCPGCGRCYAPWRGECGYCPPVKSVDANTTDDEPVGPPPIGSLSPPLKEDSDA